MKKHRIILAVLIPLMIIPMVSCEFAMKSMDFFGKNVYTEMGLQQSSVRAEQAAQAVEKIEAQNVTVDTTDTDALKNVELGGVKVDLSGVNTEELESLKADDGSIPVIVPQTAAKKAEQKQAIDAALKSNTQKKEFIGNLKSEKLDSSQAKAVENTTKVLDKVTATAVADAPAEVRTAVEEIVKQVKVSVPENPTKADLLKVQMTMDAVGALSEAMTAPATTPAEKEARDVKAKEAVDSALYAATVISEINGDNKLIDDLMGALGEFDLGAITGSKNAKGMMDKLTPAQQDAARTASKFVVPYLLDTFGYTPENGMSMQALVAKRGNYDSLKSCFLQVEAGLRIASDDSIKKIDVSMTNMANLIIANIFDYTIGLYENTEEYSDFKTYIDTAFELGNEVLKAYPVIATDLAGCSNEKLEEIMNYANGLYETEKYNKVLNVEVNTKIEPAFKSYGTFWDNLVKTDLKELINITGYGKFLGTENNK